MVVPSSNFDFVSFMTMLITNFGWFGGFLVGMTAFTLLFDMAVKWYKRID